MTWSTSDVAVCCSSDFSELARALLLRLEQPHVLDRDDGLIGERRQKSDVLLLERSHLGTADQDGAKRAAFADQRHGEDGTMSEPDRQFPPERELVAGILQVGDVDRLQIADGAAGHRGAVQRHRFSSCDSRPSSPNDAAIRNTSLSTMAISTTCASQMRAACSATESSTGCTSLGELEITRRMSLIAVCCSSDSASSRERCCSASNSRVFSIAMTAWSAKVSTSSICLSVNGRTSCAVQDEARRLELPLEAAARQGSCEAAELLRIHGKAYSGSASTSGIRQICTFRRTRRDYTAASRCKYGPFRLSVTLRRLTVGWLLRSSASIPLGRSIAPFSASHNNRASQIRAAFSSTGFEHRLAVVERLEMTRSTRPSPSAAASASSRSRVSRATFVSSRAADELRGRTAFGVMRLLRAPVLRRCAFAGSPPALERRRIAAPRLRTRHRGEVRLAHWSMVRHNLRGPIFA